MKSKPKLKLRKPPSPDLAQLSQAVFAAAVAFARALDGDDAGAMIECEDELVQAVDAWEEAGGKV